ncbi:MAG TPA: PEP-CTERM sorting domain-containing protein, partial [Isosphaeraceae bacterium]|nr:PEP-CTERM sorting domain-containing protein [Isosphaeraceae bacterium]
QAHPARFEHWHPRFWRIIDGEALEGGPPIIDPLISHAGQGGDPPVAPDPPSPPGLAGPAAAVPEPESFRLLLVALGLILVVRGGSRYLRAWIRGAGIVWGLTTRA